MAPYSEQTNKLNEQPFFLMNSLFLSKKRLFLPKTHQKCEVSTKSVMTKMKDFCTLAK